jgi:hypothetical protein
MTPRIIRGITLDETRLMLATHLTGKCLGIPYHCTEILWYLGDLVRTQLASEKNVMAVRISWN